ncbi:MAG: hypothetical protein JWM64_2707 [Frankiales bacterium]|nr:hypothetical protein [Frankiales bacterium]
MDLHDDDDGGGRVLALTVAAAGGLAAGVAAAELADLAWPGLLVLAWAGSTAGGLSGALLRPRSRSERQSRVLTLLPAQRSAQVVDEGWSLVPAPAARAGAVPGEARGRRRPRPPFPSSAGA